MTYTSVAEAKSARERYIRVAAIDIIIRDGIKNICVASTHKKLVSPPLVAIITNKDIPYRMPLNLTGESTFFVSRLKGGEVPFRSKETNTCDAKE